MRPNRPLLHGQRDGDLKSFAATLERRLRAVQDSSECPDDREPAADDRETSAGPDLGNEPASEPAPGQASADGTAVPALGPLDAAPVPELETLEGPRFDRLRSLAATAAKGGAAELLDVADGSGAGILPLDSAKTFVGPNGTYYDEHWRLMEWRGRNSSWNSAAALTLGCWLAYRRLYGCALLYCGWLGLLLLLAANGISIELLASLQAAVALTLGLYGNALYRRRFRKAALAAARHGGDHTARLAVLAAAGGIDPRAAWSMAIAVAAVIALIAGIGESVGGAALTL